MEGQLVTEQYEHNPPKYRGLHSSAIGDDYVVPMFDGYGWVDYGYTFVQSRNLPNVDVESLKELNMWALRSPPPTI
jgi:hypothetical protein